MPKASPIQSNFNGGELSPLTYGRVDADRYKIGLERCLNYIPTVQGGLTRRTGTRYVVGTKDDSVARVVAFNFSTVQSYVLEFGEDYIRICKDYGQVVDGMDDPIEIVTSYQEEDLFDLCFIQTANTLYILHPLYPPKKLTRTSDTVWTLTTIVFDDGPYLPQNKTATTLTPGGTSGSVTLTASSVAGINDGAGFLSTDIGRSVRLNHGGTWSWGVITARSSTTLVQISIDATTTASGTSLWRLGLWSDTTGYPACATFYEDRLFLAGGNDPFPQRIDGSNTGDYENFAPSDLDGQIPADRAISFNLNTRDGNAVHWLSTAEKGLLAGTSDSEWAIRSPTEGEALSPSNIYAKEVTSYGSSAVQPVRVAKSTMFLSKTRRKIREMGYNYEVDGFSAPDRTVIAEHITGTGLIELAVQKEPQQIMWAVREDGALVSMTYEQEDGALIVAWARQFIGGAGNANIVDTHALVESVTVIPSPDGTRDDVWMVVKRWHAQGFPAIAEYRRTIECITFAFDDTVALEDGVFLDCSLTYDNPITIEDMDFSDEVMIDSTGHGLSNGDKIRISDLIGVTGITDPKYVVSDVTTDTFKIKTLEGNYVFINPNFNSFVSGVYRKYVTSVSGLDHLSAIPSATVGAFIDGAIPSGPNPYNFTIIGGVFNPSLNGLAPAEFTKLTVGYRYKSQGKRLRDGEAGAADGTAQGKTRRTHRVAFQLHRTLGFYFGYEFRQDVLGDIGVVETMYPQVQRTFDDSIFDAADPLYSGIFSHEVDPDYDFNNQLCWEQRDPFPGTILAAMPQVVVQDRG